MHNLFLTTLKDHPELGIGAVLTGVLQSVITASTPILQFLGLAIGVTIGAVTLYTKVYDLPYFRRRRELKQKKIDEGAT